MNSGMLCAFFWVISRHLNFICQRLGMLCLFHLLRWVGISSYLSMYEDWTDRAFWNFGIQNSDCRELPRRKHTTFRTRQKFEIKSTGMFQIIKWRHTQHSLSQLFTWQSEENVSQLWPLYHFEKCFHYSGLGLFNCRKVVGDWIQKLHCDEQRMNWYQWKVGGCHGGVAKIHIVWDVTSWWPV